MTDEPLQLPVWIITGTNWTAEVRLDEMNASLGKEHQIFEAASRAVEAFKRGYDGVQVVPNADARQDTLFMGVTVLAHLKGTDPELAEVVATHECLGNIGLYNDAREMSAEFDKQLAIIKAQQEAQTARETKNKADIAQFEKFQKEMGVKPKTPRKPRKKKGDDLL